MPYCPRCGVEVDYNVTKCPLCLFDIPKIPNTVDIKKEEIELKNYYAELRELKKIRKKRRKGVYFAILMILIIFAGINNVIQDWYANGALIFSTYVLSSLGLLTAVLICLFGFIKNWKKIFFFLFCITLAFLFSIDMYSGKIEWFPTLALPIATASFGITFGVSYLIYRKKPGGLNNSGIIFTGISILIILLELIIDLYMGELHLTWSIQVFVSAFSLAMIFLLARKIVQGKSFRKLKRFFHF